MIKPWGERWKDGRGSVKLEQAMMDEIDELRAALAKAEQHIKHIGNDAMRTENEQLHAELAALRKQEPVAWFNAKRDMTYMSNFHKDDVPLYLSPGAGPKDGARKITVTRIASHLKKSPLGDISMYRDGFFDGAKWASGAQG